MQWALEFLRTTKKDYTYPESIRKIVRDFEKNFNTLIYQSRRCNTKEENRTGTGGRK